MAALEAQWKEHHRALPDASKSHARTHPCWMEGTCHCNQGDRVTSLFWPTAVRTWKSLCQQEIERRQWRGGRRVVMRFGVDRDGTLSIDAVYVSLLYLKAWRPTFVKMVTKDP